MPIPKKYFDNFYSAVLIANDSANIVYVNKAFEELTGYKYNDVINKNPRILSSGRQNKTFYRNLWNTINEEGRWQGELWNKRKNGENFLEHLSINKINDEDANIYYLGVFSDITEKRKNEDAVAYNAYHDQLTGLPNRRYLDMIFPTISTRSERAHEFIAILFMDLDGFKEINDSYGHVIGDIYLSKIGVLFNDNVRKNDIVARFGGDEFLVVLIGIKNMDEVNISIKRFQSIIKSSQIQINDKALDISASIGISVFPTDATDIPTLIDQADQAMYEVKRSGKNNFKFYSK